MERPMLRTWALGVLALCAWPMAAAHAQTSGSVVAWGYNGNGQCNVPEPNADFVAVSGGVNHSIGLKRNGSIVAWGANYAGQCSVPSPNSGFTAIAGGGAHSLGLKADSSIVAWGYNEFGQCDVPSPNTGFIAVAAGNRHSLGLESDGSIVAWGDNSNGQCNVPSPNTGFVATAAGYSHSLGLKSDGSIVAWGSNTAGQSNVPLPNMGFVAVAAGESHSLGLKANGSIIAWGDNKKYGQCNVPSPNTGFVTAAAGAVHSLGLKSNGSMVAWGSNLQGQCSVPLPNERFVAVAGGSHHSLGIRVVDNPPTADAGPDQIVPVGSIVSLIGNGIDDNTPSEELEYVWELKRPEGSTATIEDLNSQITFFTPDVAGTYQIRLTVLDSLRQKGIDYTVVTALLDEAPTAHAGSDQAAFVGDVVTLDGLGSSDDSTLPADLIYEWAFLEWPMNSAAVIADPAAPVVQFTPDLEGMYVVQLIVYDWLGQPSEPDMVTILAILDEPPTANAGLDQSIHGRTVVYLDGRASWDDITPSPELLYEWRFANLPPGSEAVMFDAGSASPSFFADVPGTYVAELIVRDGRGQASPPDEVVVSSLNGAPTANAGPDIVGVVGWMVVLSGAGSSDPDQDPLYCEWTLIGRPEGSTASLVDEHAVECRLTTDIPGDYLVQLVVYDLFGPSEPDVATVTAITGEDFVENVAMETIDLVVALPPEDVSSAGNQEALTNFLTEVVQSVQKGKLDQARHKLAMCLARTDGCVLRGAPDTNGPGRDWITDCETQWQVYAELMLALEAIEE